MPLDICVNFKLCTFQRKPQPQKACVLPGCLQRRFRGVAVPVPKEAGLQQPGWSGSHAARSGLHHQWTGSASVSIPWHENYKGESFYVKAYWVDICRTGKPNVVQHIKIAILQWAEHVQRLGEYRSPKMVMVSHSDGRRSVGWLRWVDDVE